MPYIDIVTRSFRIAWNHKYLWLIALFSGEAGSFNFNYSQGTNRNTDVGTAQQQLTTWLGDNAGLVAVLTIVAFIVSIGFFLLAAICEGATIRAAAEHDAERPFGLRQAWTMGVHTMWVIVRFRLLLLLVYLPFVILIVAWLVALLAAIAQGNAAAIAGLAAGGLAVLLALVVAAIYVFFLDRLGSRAVILEERKAIPAIARAHRLLFKRFGRTLLVWLLSIAVAVVVGVAALCLSTVIGLPFYIAITAAASTGSPILWPIVAVGLLVALPAYLVVFGFLGAQGASYWTLAFRRLDVDYPQAYAYPFPRPMVHPPTPPVLP